MREIHHSIGGASVASTSGRLGDVFETITARWSEGAVEDSVFVIPTMR